MQPGVGRELHWVIRVTKSSTPKGLHHQRPAIKFLKTDALAIQAERRILLIRKQRVILDYDLATLYSVETRALKQAVDAMLTDFQRISCSNWPRRRWMPWYHKT